MERRDGREIFLFVFVLFLSGAYLWEVAVMLLGYFVRRGRGRWCWFLCSRVGRGCQSYTRDVVTYDQFGSFYPYQEYNGGSEGVQHERRSVPTWRRTFRYGNDEDALSPCSPPLLKASRRSIRNLKGRRALSMYILRRPQAAKETGQFCQRRQYNQICRINAGA